MVLDSVVTGTDFYKTCFTFKVIFKKDKNEFVCVCVLFSSFSPIVLKR